ncbi:MAG: hypothetical protein H7123_03265, partial [Thermoleophilia bacterium]|nr:hypothetical protein [Thermoleophilia bacterium]
MALLPALAQADERIATSYSSSAAVALNGAGAPIDCGKVWSGGTDGAGNFYTPCANSSGSWVFIFNPTGAFSSLITIPSPYTAMRDVAATVDGNSVYIITSGVDRRVDIDQPNPAVYPNNGKVLRFVKATDGSWSQDTSFVINPISWIQGGNAWA